jgi:dTDP-4-dehydrorhamnose reductase
MKNLKVKILILDSTGMAGHVISQYMKDLNKYQVYEIVCDISLNNHINYLDVYDRNLLYQKIKNINPDFIINCLRLLIEESEENQAKAVYYNSYIPHYLSEIGNEINAKIIHLSTDCVFSGKKGSYHENDIKDGENVYARTKALGELINDRDLTVRTSFIGPNINGRNEELFHWFLNQKGEINGYANAFWTGITTLELAKLIVEVLDLNITGIYHLVPEHKISKYNLLNLIKNIWLKEDVIIRELNNISVDKSLIDNHKLLNVNNYYVMFNEMYKWMLDNKELYTNYF